MTAAHELAPLTAREAQIARLGKLIGELTAAGDLVGASVAATQLARLVGESSAPSAAAVIDLNTRRARR